MTQAKQALYAVVWASVCVSTIHTCWVYADPQVVLVL